MAGRLATTLLNYPRKCQVMNVELGRIGIDYFGDSVYGARVKAGWSLSRPMLITRLRSSLCELCQHANSDFRLIPVREMIRSFHLLKDNPSSLR